MKIKENKTYIGLSSCNKILIYLKKFMIHLNYLKFVIIYVLIIYENV